MKLLILPVDAMSLHTISWPDAPGVNTQFRTNGGPALAVRSFLSFVVVIGLKLINHAEWAVNCTAVQYNPHVLPATIFTSNMTVPSWAFNSPTGQSLSAPAFSFGNNRF